MGSGGREAALCHKINDSKFLNQLHVIGYIAGVDAKFVNIDSSAIEDILNYAKLSNIDLTIVGPENPLELGIVDLFEKHNLKIFGPNQQAVKLETDKSFSKYLMHKYDIPTAKFEVFDEYDACMHYGFTVEFPIVVKFSGLAFGKGVVIAQDFNQYQICVEQFLKTRIYGAGKVVVEQFLVGEEFSYIGVVDKEQNFTPFETCRDYKREFDNDLGENTGGMGMVCPHPFIDDADLVKANTIVNNTLAALKSEGVLYQGFIYAGLIKTSTGIEVIEFNARMGDPEGEILFEKLTTDILVLIDGCVTGYQVDVEFDSLYYHGVVLAAAGYPRSYTKEIDVSKYDMSKYLAMNVDKNGLSAGGRVLFKKASNISLEAAMIENYQYLEKNNPADLIYRKDIGKNLLK